MSTVRLVTVLGRVVTVALLTLFMSGQAFAELCIDMNLRLDEREPPAAIVESMKNEATAIWGPYGVWFRWEATPSLAQCVWTQASFDVLLNRSPQPGWSTKQILGSTHLALRAIDHVPIHIDREATEELLGSASVGQLARLLGRTSFGPEDIGRALGRVLAHEVGHVLLAVRDHQPRGLMRPTFGAEDLLEPQRRFYTLSSAEVTRLRQRERVLDVDASQQIHDCPWRRWLMPLPTRSDPISVFSSGAATDRSQEAETTRVPDHIVAQRAWWGGGCARPRWTRVTEPVINREGRSPSTRTDARGVSRARATSG